MARGSVNKVIIIGRLGGDPEIRYSTSGVPVANFNVATNERAPVGEGNWEDRTEWHRIVAFDKQAEFCGNYLNKGKQVYIEGKLRTEQWEDAQGVKRSTTKIVAREIQLLGSPEGPAGQAQPSQGAYKSPSPQASRPSPEELPPPSGAPEDDIPF